MLFTKLFHSIPNYLRYTFKHRGISSFGRLPFLFVSFSLPSFFMFVANHSQKPSKTPNIHGYLESIYQNPNPKLQTPEKANMLEVEVACLYLQVVVNRQNDQTWI